MFCSSKAFGILAHNLRFGFKFFFNMQRMDVNNKLFVTHKKSSRPHFRNLKSKNHFFFTYKT